MVRASVLRSNDLQLVKEIHEKYYQKEFSFPDFSKNFLTAFKVIDDNGQLVTAGGVKTYPEFVCITDKEKSPRDRVQALKIGLNIARHVASVNEHQLLYATTKNTDFEWDEIILKSDFRVSRSKFFVTEL